jgi:DNA-directed RNA polymerase subunit H (RpoH/RPB5)
MSSETTMIYNSRKNLLDSLSSLGYKTDEYMSFSTNEVEAMIINNQLDMLIEYSAEVTAETAYAKTKVYVKHMLNAKAIRLKSAIEEIIEELYDLEEVLTKRDTLIVVVNDEPNDTMVEKLKFWHDSRGIHVVIHNIKRLQYNILKHSMVPKHEILTETQTMDLMKQYNLNTVKQLPEISRFDPVSLMICMRPGQVCKITRKSQTSVVSDYYRVCV